MADPHGHDHRRDHHTVYYSATNTDPQCKNEAWAGWVCKTTPGGAPSAGFAIPTSWVTSYDVYGNVLRTVETGQGVTRTSDTAYDAAGRARRSSLGARHPPARRQHPRRLHPHGRPPLLIQPRSLRQR